jgi:RimJ/RimL family protein N-acetyltransferase
MLVLWLMPERLTTDRLVLRRWQESDREPFRALNADARVLEFFPALLKPEESDQAITRIELHFERHGFGLHAAELIETGKFIGFVGLNVPAFDAPFMPAVEIGWRLAYEQWGQGLATEGASAMLRSAWEDVRLTSLVSFTSAANLRSRRVMEKIGMTRDATADFEHPNLPDGHPLRRHVLYRIASQTNASIPWAKSVQQ